MYYTKSETGDLELAQLSSVYRGAYSHGVGSTPVPHVASWQIGEAAIFEEVDEGGPPVASTLMKAPCQPSAPREVAQLAR